jgi:hypothetical protein
MKLVSTRSQNMICDISDLRRGLFEVSALLGCWGIVCCLLDTVISGQHIGPIWKATLKMGLMCCPETSVTSYQHMQRNISTRAKTSECNIFTLQKSVTAEGYRTCHRINTVIYNAIQVLNTWVVQVYVVILQEYHIKQNKI